jgi:hypothetical protein
MRGIGSFSRPKGHNLEDTPLLQKNCAGHTVFITTANSYNAGDPSLEVSQPNSINRVYTAKENKDATWRCLAKLIKRTL